MLQAVMCFHAQPTLLQVYEGGRGLDFHFDKDEVWVMAMVGSLAECSLKLICMGLDGQASS